MQKNISQQVFLSIKQVLLLSLPHITLTAIPADCLVHEFSSPLLPALNWEEKIGTIKGPFPWWLLLLLFKGHTVFWRKGNTLKLWHNYYANQYLSFQECVCPGSSDKSNLQPGRKLKGKDHEDKSCLWLWRLIAKWLGFNGVPADMTGGRPLFTSVTSISDQTYTLSGHIN